MINSTCWLSSTLDSRKRILDTTLSTGTSVVVVVVVAVLTLTRTIKSSVVTGQCYVIKLSLGKSVGYKYCKQPFASCQRD